MDAVIAYFDRLSLNLLGLNFSLSNILILGVFFGIGYFIGKLTVRITVKKIALLVVLLLLSYSYLATLYFVLIWAIALGILYHHRHRIRSLFMPLRRVVWGIFNNRGAVISPFYGSFRTRIYAATRLV